MRMILLTILVCLCCSVEADTEARQLMQKNFFASKISGFSGTVSMELVNRKGQSRSRKLEMWSKLKKDGTDSQVLMRFIHPTNIKGTSFLQIENSSSEDDIWVYLPALGKIRRLISSNRRDSFFGTDFSYGDVLLPPVRDYEHVLLREESAEGEHFYVVESKPISKTARINTGYLRKITWINAKTFFESKVEYYDLTGKLLKTQYTYLPKLVEPESSRWMSMHREMHNHQTGHKTIYRFDRFNLDENIQDVMFTTRNMER